MFGGGASVSWHFESEGPEVTAELEELHPTLTAMARAGKNANGHRPTWFPRTAARHEEVVVECIEALYRKYTPLGRRIPCASNLMSFVDILPE
jgi:hypothetical protein